MTLTIGDTDRSGTFQIMDTNWNGNGTMRVTVRETVGGGCLDMTEEQMIRAMRRLARRAIDHPRKSPVVNRFTHYGCQNVTFAVSRIEGN